MPNSQIQKQLENAQRNEKLSYFDAHPETELSRISLPYVEVEVTSEQFKGKYYKLEGSFFPVHKKAQLVPETFY